MDDTEILLSDSTNNEEKCRAANNIIVNYELPLSMDKILLAFEKIVNYLKKFSDKIINEEHRKNRLFLLDKVLNINKNMYISIILALCDDFPPISLHNFMILDDNYKAIDIGLPNYTYHHNTPIRSYYTLLNYYEFDVSNILEISDTYKQLIQAYRTEKYSCKTVKCAIKK